MNSTHAVAARSPRRSSSGAQVNQSFSLIGPLFSIGGDVHVGDRSTEVDLSAEDVIDKLEIGGIAGYRAESPKWSFMVEGAFVGLGQTNHGLTMDLDMTVIEADAGYRLGERSELFAGVRYTGLDVEIAGTHPALRDGVRAEERRRLLRPDRRLPLRGAALGLRRSGESRAAATSAASASRWTSPGRRSSTSATARATRWSIWLGYRALAQDFDDSGKNDRFAMDAIYQGPQVGISWMF